MIGLMCEAIVCCLNVLSVCRLPCSALNVACSLPALVHSAISPCFVMCVCFNCESKQQGSRVMRAKANGARQQTCMGGRQVITSGTERLSSAIQSTRCNARSCTDIAGSQHNNRAWQGIRGMYRGKGMRGVAAAPTQAGGCGADLKHWLTGRPPGFLSRRNAAAGVP